MKLSQAVCGLVLFALSGCASTAPTLRGTNQDFKMIAVEMEGTKIWLPSTFTVNKGDKVTFHAVSLVPGPVKVHGFAIEEFKVQELIEGKTKDISFVADRAGIFPIKCHLHPGHIGGQLIVLDTK